ncbi:MAG: cation-translocating P-type ATPase, partial [Verrucomicrobiota bacterium]
LLAAGVVSLAIQHWSDAAFIFAVLAFNAILGTIQEYKAQTSAQSLQGVIKKTAKVLRGGERREVDAEELVPGDVVLLSTGEAVPADCRLIEARDLRIDESLLTGESVPVEKDADAEVDDDAPVSERANYAHAGTSVTDGRARAVVCATATHTEVGRIAESLTEETEDPPLVQRMRKLTRGIAVFILVAVILLGAVELAAGSSWSETFLLVVALAVSAIPAGLPVAVTVALSVASHRMAKRNVIVRHLPAVEGLGSCTTICSDKTGTLTENRLTANRIVLPDGDRFAIGGEGLELSGRVAVGDAPDEGEEADDSARESLQAVALAGILPNEAQLGEEEDGRVAKPSGDTVDVAFLILARKLGMEPEAAQEEHEQVGEIPYSSEQKFAASFNRSEDGIAGYVKGATETVLDMCELDEERREELTEQSRELASQGFRVLALASGRIEKEEQAREGEAECLQGLEFRGLVGLIDPVRAEVPEAVRHCKDAGVRVRMVTGDQPETAQAIGRDIGIGGDQPPLTGREMREMLERDAGEDEDLAEAAQHSESFKDAVRDRDIFARVEPHQKTALVESLQNEGDFVAVTGDGVNDAPALNAAHISVAMGKGGTDVARRTAKLILGDDNFASIVNGIEEGRIAYDNVRKVVWLLVSTSVAEIVLFALALSFRMEVPLFAAQLLWLNLVTNGIQDVALAFEGREPGVLKRPPRKPNERIFNRRMLEQVALAGGWMGLCGFGVFYYLIEIQGASLEHARNVVLLLMVLFENAHIFNCRSEERSAFQVPIWRNWLLIGTVAAAQGVHIAAMFIPGLSGVLGASPLPFMTWLSLLGIALTIIVVVEIYKWLRK